MSRLKRQRSKNVLKISAVKFKSRCSATSFAHGTAVQNADYCHAFEKFEKRDMKRDMFLSPSFRPAVSDFSMKEEKISITNISITITQYYYIVISTIPE